MTAATPGGAGARPFNVHTVELQPGVSVIEASAGTGKTYTLSRLVGRYVLEWGVPVSRLLIVTFTRAAAEELRARVRGHLVELRGAEGRTPEQIERLDAALADFDAATIATIHGFCRQVLGRLGVEAPGDPADELRNDDRELIAWYCGDLLAALALEAESSGNATAALPSLGDLTHAVDAMLHDPAVRLWTGPDTEAAESLRGAAEQVVDRVRAARRAAGYRTQDELIATVARLAADVTVQAKLRDRFGVVLIDEFQDTDATQWGIFKRLFVERGCEAGTATVLVGDPKQAIYRFRGADVDAYLSAVRDHIDRRFTLDTNHRTEESLLETLNRLQAGAAYGIDVEGAPVIEFEPVRAAAGEAGGNPGGSAGTGSPIEVGFDVRILGPEHANQLGADRRAEVVVNDLVEVANRLRGEGAKLDDIVVLVRTAAQARQVLEALRAAAVPAILTSATDVFQSDAAAQWRTLLTAIDRPADARLVRAAAAGWFIGATPTTVATATDDQLAGWQEALTEAGVVLGRGGMHRLLQTVAGWPDERGDALASRVLRRVGGARHLTDLEHITELLSARTGAAGVSASVVLSALDASAVEQRNEDDANEVKGRVETAGGAIRITTMHAAKGLEYEVVLLPFVWKPPSVKGPFTVRIGSGERQGSWKVIGSEVPTELKRRADLESLADELRLLYVAITRAKRRLVCWWVVPETKPRSAKSVPKSKSPFGRLMLARQTGPDGTTRVLPDRLLGPDGTETPAQVSGIRDLLGDLLGPGSVLRLTEIHPSAGPPPRFHAAAEQITPVAGGAELRVAQLPGRVLGRLQPQRTSFTRLTAGLHEHRRPETGEADGHHGSDEPALPEAPLGLDGSETEVVGSGAVASPWAEVTGGGTALGTLVHEALEVLAPVSGDHDLPAAVAAALQAAHCPIDARPSLTDALVAALRTPLGPQLEEQTLARISRTDQLRELDFEIPLGERSPVTIDALRSVLETYLDGPGAEGPYRSSDLLGPVGDPAAAERLVGVLNGSIDLVARIGSGPAQRFWVMDYKTNRLSGPEAYQPGRLPEAMSHARYPLQALLYLVALHRYLRWRLPGYAPERHLGGAAYLFVRAMSGPDVRRDAEGCPDGIALWRPPSELIEAVSDLLHGGGVALAGGRAAAEEARS